MNNKRGKNYSIKGEVQYTVLMESTGFLKSVKNILSMSRFKRDILLFEFLRKLTEKLSGNPSMFQFLLWNIPPIGQTGN